MSEKLKYLTKAQTEALKELRAEYGDTVTEFQDFLKSKGYAPYNPTLGEILKEGAVTGLMGLGKGMDFATGAATARMKVMESLAEKTLKDPAVKKEDKERLSQFMEDARKRYTLSNLEGVPGMSEFAEASGVPAGMTLSNVLPDYFENKGAPWYKPEKGGLLDLSLRGAGGFAADVALDPSMWLSGTILPIAKGAAKALGKQLPKWVGTSAARKALAAQSKIAASGMLPTAGQRLGTQVVASLLDLPSALGAPLKNLAQYRGARMVKNALRPIDVALSKTGKLPYSDIAIERRVFGGMPTVYKDIEKMSGELGTKLEDILARAELASPRSISAAKTTEQAKSLLPEFYMGTEKKVAEHMKPILEGAEKQIKSIEDMGMLTGPEAIRLKRSLYSDIPGSSWDLISRTEKGAEIQKQLAAGLKEATETQAKGIGEDIAGLNELWGRVLESKKVARPLAYKEEFIKDFPSGFEGGITAATGSVAPVLARRAAETLRLPGLRIPAGQTLHWLGRMDPIMAPADAAFRRWLIQQGYDPDALKEKK